VNGSSSSIDAVRFWQGTVSEKGYGGKELKETPVFYAFWGLSPESSMQYRQITQNPTMSEIA
jgi:hypothetical protein